MAPQFTCLYEYISLRKLHRLIATNINILICFLGLKRGPRMSTSFTLQKEKSTNRQTLWQGRAKPTGGLGLLDLRSTSTLGIIKSALILNPQATLDRH
jgi:hypothetical protein